MKRAKSSGERSLAQLKFRQRTAQKTRIEKPTSRMRISRRNQITKSGGCHEDRKPPLCKGTVAKDLIVEFMSTSVPKGVWAAERCTLEKKRPAT